MNNYIDKVKFTETKEFNAIKERLGNDNTLRLLHASMGMSTEASECLDLLKKHIYYGKELDTLHLKEEVGDLLYYTAVALDVLNLSFEDAMEININKLRKRYPNGFESDKAIRREALSDEKAAMLASLKKIDDRGRNV